MPANFSVQFIVNEKTQSRVLKLTDASSGFTLAKGNFSITFPDGSTRIKTDFTSPDITAPLGFISIPAVLDNNNNVITGTYKIDFVALNAANTSYSSTISFDFNWVKPTNGITNLSDVLIPEVKFQDTTSYSPIGSFTGTLTRTLSASFPTTSEASGGSVSTVSSNLIDMVSSGKYYDGTYTPSSDVNVNYTKSGDSRITISYIELFTKTILIKRCPTQIDLINKINGYRAVIEAYKEKNDTQFNILSEQYDLAIALYSHVIARYETSTQDGSEGQLRELLSILEPYSTSYTPQLTRMLPFEIASTGTNSFVISDGTSTDTIPLGSTLLLSSGNPALTIGVSNNLVTYTPVFGTTSNTFAQGNDSRLHNPVTIGTANGLSLASQVLSLAAATVSTSGAMSAADKAKLDGIASGANVGTVTSVGLSAPTAFTVTNSPVTGSGTIVLSANGSPSQYITGAGALATFLTDVRAGISLTTTGTSGAATYNSTTGVLNIPQYQGGVTSFNTRTGAVSLSSTDVTDALGFTPYNATNPSSYITLTSLSSSATGLTYTNTTGVFSFSSGYAIPTTIKQSNWDDAYTWVSSFPTQTGNTGKFLTTNGSSLSWATVTSGVSSFNTRTGAITLTSGDVTTALTYTPQQPITLTTTGTSGAATFIGNTLNIPQYSGGSGSGSLRGLQNYTATAGQTTFTVTAGYVVGQIDVFLNGVRLTAADYTASNGTTVVLGTGALVNDIVDVLYYTSLTGYVSAASKQDALSGTGFVKITGTTISYDNSTYLTSYTETDPVFVASPAYGITGTNITNWGSAYSWGNHALAGYLTSYTETDPVFLASAAYGITSTNISNWNTAYGWGNHASAGYLTTSSAASTYQPLDADLTAIAAIAGTSGLLKKTAANTWSLDTSTYLTSYTETDPIYTASSWYTTTNNSTNWNTAYTNRITSLTTTGSSGSATLTSNTLNIPTYTLSGLGGQASSTNLTSLSGLTYVSASFVKMTAAGTFALDTNTYYLSSNPSGYTNNTGTVTSVGGTGTAFGLTLTGTVTTSGSLTLGGTLAVPIANITATGTPSSTTYLRGDGTWSTVSSTGGGYTTTSQTSNYSETATTGTKIILGNTTGGTFTITLPTAVGNAATIIVKKTAGTAGLVIDGAGTETIDGGLTATINKVYESITLISDNTNWQII